MCGGKNDILPPMTICTVYNATANMWTSSSSMPVPAEGLTMITLHGNAFVFGGIDNNDVVMNTVYTFDSGVWRARTPMPVTLYFHNAVAMADTQSALVCGGKTTASDNSTHSNCYT
jgi:N-acetylneuraminic acid mutarotase